MRKRFRSLFIFTLIFLFRFYPLPGFSQELPKPGYDNSLIFSFTYPLPVPPSAEVDYIKSQFGNGLYAPLGFSNFVSVAMDWHAVIANADNGIKAFKNNVDTLISRAKSYGVGVHLILIFGLSRNVDLYKSAKNEDLRNAQWYNDNNLASQAQLDQAAGLQGEDDGVGFDPLLPGELPALLSPGDEIEKSSAAGNSAPYVSEVNYYVFTTFSRYARKLRAHLEAKTRAAFAYLQQKQDENPGMVIVVSAPGETELSSLRQNPSPPLQEFFCDYSPFAVLEFRDWIKHEGMYGSGGKYEGEGYVNGGSRYQGARGLQNFNRDFATLFGTWNLKYYPWSLADPVDTDYTDNSNPDPHLIPLAQYSFGNMMPGSGPGFIANGFDPPRVMREPGADAYWDLWQHFRETMVYHMVKDIATLARQSGFAKNRFYTHQIPGDYLWGTNPANPAVPPNARYYASASPLWTAKAYSDMGMGLTLYDINFVSHYARTSQFVLPAVSASSDNWGAMEYNPEIIVSNNINDVNTVETIYQQMKRLYDYHVHVLNFYQWGEAIKYRFYGNNRETAAKRFFDAVKDKARQSLTTVFTPKPVENFTGQYNKSTGVVDLSWGTQIWTDLTYNWEDWGDFREFALYRGYTDNFPVNSSTEIKRVSGYSYRDSGFANSPTIYYKLAAVNVNGVGGKPVTIGVNTGTTGTPQLTVSRTRLNVGASTGGIATAPQFFSVRNGGTGILNWEVSEDVGWLSCTPVMGTNTGKVQVTVHATGLSPGTYNGTITVSAPGAVNSPRTIAVKLAVYAKGKDLAPFGTFATPLPNSTVRSSIPVTGWVLDDIGVESVKLYRRDGSKLVPVGDAVLVEGARPDVEEAYPGYPDNYKAGWGYMMLTNFLPGQGNGKFTFVALARDVTGHQVTLGSKTVICDNANAVKPFGAIETPKQGGDASGTAFINWGWALTPQPNRIPDDGSTIHVMIDGVPLGHPVYNRFRSDIAAKFPGYNNSHGAVGYFYLDTTAYANGIHTISWSVRDSAGNEDGIGSRYFSIENQAATQQAAGSWPEGNRTFPESPGDFSKIPVAILEPVEVKTGYHEKSSLHTCYPGENNEITIKIRETEPLEIHLTSRTKEISPLPVCAGYQRIGSELRQLPTGSILDPGAGIFYWLPGPGYVGKYRLLFISGTGTGKPLQTKVTIDIIPKWQQ
jgi:hypothetical protein